MYSKKECIAMLLAGGQGSRLAVLTKKVAKPAIPFGGKYRIIDFTLSNCINSGIDTVGVLTQYMPLELNSYIGNGQPWDMDRNSGGVSILPPYMTGKQGEWYKGTANAIYQNISFIEQYDPEYVVILSGDHIYKMDYSRMVSYHREKGASCTIAVLNVPLSEASRFGIMNTDGENRIYEFEEKPKCPKSTKASMGVYVFSWKVLRAYLMEDEANPASENDFGKNIIPDMLGCGEPMYAYEFDGYWKDVGTLTSLWEANMELLGTRPAVKLSDPSWRICARSTEDAPAFIAPEAKIVNSMMSKGSEVYGTVVNTVVSNGCYVGPGAFVKDTVLMPYSRVGAGASVEYAILGQRVGVGENARVGAPKDAPREGVEKHPMAEYLAVIGDNLTVSPGATVRPATVLEENL